MIQNSRFLCMVWRALIFVCGIGISAPLAAQDVRQAIEQAQDTIRRLQRNVALLQKDIAIWQQNLYLLQLEDTVLSPGFIHSVGIEARPQYVFPTNSFLEGENAYGMPISRSSAAHLKYAFRFRPGTPAYNVYGGSYQGLGVSVANFGDKKQLGEPISFYIFQGARLARFGRRLSLNYEWNLGLSTGWVPYDEEHNPFNRAMGSRINAYINAGIYLNWSLSRHFDILLGADLTHFSNGNTKFPNAGLNTGGAKIGLVYNLNRKAEEVGLPSIRSLAPRFPRHISYDWVMFGAWRRKGVFVEEHKQVASPVCYPVAGFSFAPMYNLNYKLRIGVSLDGVYDGSANVFYMEESDEVRYADVEYDPKDSFHRPKLERQVALGMSGRAEYVMPYFTIGVGLGANLLGHGDLRGYYQTLALKVAVSRNSFLHIGYNLHNFQTPNYLMLGLGFRFHNKYPKLRH